MARFRLFDSTESLRHSKWFLLVLMILFVQATALAADFRDCRRCHEAELDSDARRPYPHIPFNQQKCAACHAVEAPVSPATDRNEAASESRKARQKIAWMGEGASLDSEHGFMFSGDRLGEVLVVEVQGQNKKYPRREIEVPLLAEVDPVGEQGAPPEISEVRVLQVKRGVFLSVTVGWRTDTLTDAQVRYGEKDLSQTSDRSTRLGRSHEVELHDLKPDKTYTFRVISTDIFGRSRTSEPLSFSTAKPMAKLGTRAMSDAGDEKEVTITSRFRRYGNDYLVELTMSRPVSVFVGSKGDVRKQESPEEKLPATDPEEAEESHAGLSEGTLLNIAACRNCHRTQGSATHPVNVLPKPGMTIPPEYPTLPDGRITCASCHATHGSDYEYLAVRPGRRELCVGCHRDML